jgi:probable HAF family extracellular repeat protein
MIKNLTIILAAVMLTACSDSTPPLPPSIQTIHVSALTNSVVLGDSVEVRATATAADGSPFTLTAVGWTSSNVAIATVTATGPVTAEVRTISAGSVTITATVESHSGQLSLAVTPPPPPLPQTSAWLAFIWSSETGMTALTFPPGVGESIAVGINDFGQVIGSVVIDDRRHAFVWTLEGGMVDIGGLAGSLSNALTAINNAGQVVGTSVDGSGHLQAFRWSPTEGISALPLPPGTVSSYARGINARGDVVGERNGSAGQSLPFRWTQENGTEDLTPVGSDSYASAFAIADNGDVVGYSGGTDDGNDVARAVLWSADGTKRIIDACTEGYVAYDFTYVCHSSANAINGAGQIVVDWGSSLAVLSAVGVRQNIAGINGSLTSDASAINEAGQVVGFSYVTPSQLRRAFLWSPSGTIDLGALPGRQWSTAHGINNRGQVVGSSY